MSGDAYIYDQGWASERDRLAALARIYDGATFRLLDTLGVAAGSRCLEVGAGEGSVARWLAERVGPSGHVLAVDLDPRFIEAGGALDVRQHDILDGPPAESAFDFVHARAVVEWIPDRRTALVNMVQSLKPGGTILVEDVDLEFAALGHPASELRAKLVRALGSLTAAGGADLTFGRQLRAVVEEIGVVDVGCEAHGTVQRGGEPTAEFQRLTLEQLGPMLVQHGLASQDEVDEGLRELSDPAVLFYPPLMVSVWGRRGVAHD